MRPFIILLSILVSTSLLCAQDIEMSAVPAAVMDQFTLLYPDAKSISWELTHDHYKADFKNNKMATLALIAPDGSLLQTETHIKITALPEPALTYLVKTYGEKKIEQATIKEDELGIITFTAIANKLDYSFDSAGHLLGRNEVAIGSRNKDE